MSEIRIRVSTDQEAFDLVWDHFITHRHGPGRRVDGPGCVAFDERVPHRRCAISVLTDLVSLRALAAATPYGRVISDRDIYLAAVKAGISEEFLTALAVDHDALAKGPYFRRRFAGALRNIASRYGLTVPNDSDQLPARWSVKHKRQRPTETLRQLAAAVPGTEDWLRGGASA